jgi:hypothetical protein
MKWLRGSRSCPRSDCNPDHLLAISRTWKDGLHFKMDAKNSILGAKRALKKILEDQQNNDFIHTIQFHILPSCPLKA